MQRVSIFFLITFFCILQLQAQWSDDPSVNTIIASQPGTLLMFGNPRVATASNGNTYVAWHKSAWTYGYDSLKLQLFDPAGNKLWEEYGILVTSNFSWFHDYSYDISVDKDNCAIIVVADDRNDLYTDTYIYKISPAGNHLWNPGGILLSDSIHTFSPKLVVLPDNSSIIVMVDKDYYYTNLILQRVSGEGSLQWGSDGLIIPSPTSLGVEDPAIILSDSNAVIVSWYDHTGDWKLMAHKIDTGGAYVWPTPLTVTHGQSFSRGRTQLVSDAAGGAFICWPYPYSQTSNVYLQHLDAYGIKTMPEETTVAELSSGYNHYPSMVFLPSDSMLYCFYHHIINSGIMDVCGQKFDISGSRQWSDTAKTFTHIINGDVYSSPIVAKNAQNGSVVFFHTHSVNPFYCSYWAMRISQDGDFVWPGEILPLSTSNLPYKSFLSVGDLSNDQWITAFSTYPDFIMGQNIKTDGSLGPWPVGDALPKSFGAGSVTLSDPFPNPATEQMTLVFSVNSPQPITISLWDAYGRLIETLVDKWSETGTFTICYDFMNGENQKIPSGLYLIKLQTPSRVTVKKMIVADSS